MTLLNEHADPKSLLGSLSPSAPHVENAHKKWRKRKASSVILCVPKGAFGSFQNRISHILLASSFEVWRGLI